MSAPTAAQITTLYQSTLKASKQFASYNFRNYFVLRTESHFKAPPSPATISWYNTRVRELEVLRRSAIINRLYEGPRLVVEAGVEVSTRSYSISDPQRGSDP
ncbi:hypothetical protein BDY24DRAFT_384195 [Mrakia frigida]|uniref:Isd11p n=1 Tax=Mrakia frigida TaxID=29902 RepID=UPI003FCC0171